MGSILLLYPSAIIVGVILGLLGSGGSILTVPVLIYVLGQDEKTAIGSSLVIVGIIAVAGSVPYIKDKLVEWRCVLLFGIPGMAGTYVGAWAAVFVPGIVQLVTFAVVMLGASYLMFRPIVVSEVKVERQAIKISLDGLIVGILTGFVGVGGGFLIVPALVLLAGLSMQMAVGTSLVIIAAKSASGFIKYIEVFEELDLHFDIELLVVFSIFGILGTFVGRYISKRIHQELLRHGFAVFLFLMGGFILASSLHDLTI